MSQPSGLTVLGLEEIQRLLVLEDLIDPVAEAFAAFSAGQAGPPAISVINFPNGGDMHIKSARIANRPYCSVKIASTFPSNLGKGLNPLDGMVLLFNAETGHPVLVLHDRAYITNLRTAAAGAVAARELANPIIHTVGVIGTGIQGRLQLEALRLVRPFAKALIWGPDRSRTEDFAARLQTDFPGSEIWVSPDCETLVRQADLLITATPSRTTLVRTQWLHPGQHITAVGGDEHGKFELEGSVLRRADRLFVDSLEANLRFGDVINAIEGGHISSADVTGELGDVLLGRCAGREHEDQITVCKLVGLGVQDLVAAELIWNKLRQ
jgi:ornithine cyclodeaminase/alanine dehydrogenase-like protein (mu-crystallin family)